MKKLLLPAILLFFLLVGLPLLGLIAAGKNVSLYYEFPPLTHYVSHAPFSGPLFAALALLGILTGAFLFFQLKQQPATRPAFTPRFPLPWWGYLGLFLILAGWIAAWNRFTWLTPWQAHTFLPLWLGYILLINGLSYCRSGTSLLTTRTGYFFTLFPVSAVFWWFFEYLNRFVQNWYYVGIENFSAVEYAVYASLSFATVLPAVLSTEELLTTFPKLTGPLTSSFVIKCRKGRSLAIVLLLISAGGLTAIGILPDYLFPLLWLSPLIILVSGQQITGQASLFDPITRGDWRPIWLPALAALVCGFFWELWNAKSYAHWVYSIPFVQQAHIFEMPILGYLGYLPFGLECKAIGLFIEKLKQ